MPNRDMTKIHPELRRRVHLIAAEWNRTMPRNPVLIVTEGWRSRERQAELWSQGRTTPGPGVDADHPLGRTVTKARPGRSAHEYGLAVDFGFEDREAGGMDWSWGLFEALGVVIEKYGLEWGGSWGDGPHAQAPGFSWQRARSGLELEWGELPCDVS